MFSIIIPSWNNLAHLRLCVHSIRRNSACTHELLIHVNDGSDGTLDWVRAEGIRHTMSPDNIGICHAVNWVATQATQDYVVYMNDDMYCCPGWDRALVSRIGQMPSDLFMLSGTMIEPANSGNRCVVTRDFGRDVATFDESALLRESASLAREDWYGASWPPTLVHRQWWQKLGGYSSELSPGMSSDNDFSMKMWDAGCRVFVGVGDSLVYHFQQKTTAKVVKNDGRTQFLRKWGMTQSTFNRHYLRSGEPMEATRLALREPKRNGAWHRAMLKSRLKLALS
jgi:glycosyltransferase involved in cell wall biosynthesis